MPDVRVEYQYDDLDCGNACIAMIARYYGYRLSRERISEVCKVTMNGVSFAALRTAGERIRLQATGLSMSLDVLVRQQPLPCILHWNDRHFVVLTGIRNTRHGPVFKVADPAYGYVNFSRKEMEEHWIIPDKGRGYLMVFRPEEDFLERNEEYRGRGLGVLWRYFRQYRTALLKIGICVLLGSLLQFLLPFLTQTIVDVGIGERNLRLIYLILAAQMMLVIGRTAGDFVRRWILLRISVRINLSLISDFLQKMVRLPMSFFDTKRTGDILQRIEDHRTVESFITSKALEALFSSVTLLVFSGVLFYYNVRIFLVFLVSSVLYGLWVSFFLRRKRLLNYRFFNKRAQNSSSTWQMVTGMEEMKLQGCADRKRKEWERVQWELSELQSQSLRLDQKSEAGSVLINEGRNVVIMVMAATSVLSGDITLGMMLSIQYIIGQLAVPVEQAVEFVFSLQEVRISLDRIDDVYIRKDEASPEQIIPSAVPEGDIVVDNLRFSYDTTNNVSVIDGLTCVVRRGRTTAVVGSSGSGKTTLLKLLLQYYRPAGGSIRIGDTDLYDLNPDWWREQCGTVMQEGSIFSDSIERNIAPKEGEVNRDNMIYAARIAAVHDTVMSLPLKYDTFIGADGQGVSTGQKQRLLIARAVYRNAPFLFLDEATNSLDTRTEAAIVSGLEEFFRGRTVLVIAHRLSTVRNADSIIVLDKGRSVGQGTHDELMASCSQYRELVRSQLN